MKRATLTSKELRLIDGLVEYFKENISIFDGLIYQIKGHVDSSPILRPLVHFMKGRVKDPAHLKDKLIRKGLEARLAGKKFPFDKDNLFRSINDLAGFRIIHLHTRQIEKIHAALLSIFEEQRWVMLETPSARTWDDESREFFAQLGIETINSESMYTSIHYIVQPNTRTEASCEIQVRTLMEEVWGEVDHKINYPVKSDSVSCREQIKVLARVTSSCSRLVDSIFLTDDKYKSDVSSADVRAPKVRAKRG